MNVQSAASRQARQAPAANFTGAVFQDPLARADGPSKTNATTETFVPAARTVWHKHDMRQILVVTAGVGILQIKGRPKPCASAT
jgi:quercetin dioxygenase-like cupin family protein